MFGHGRVLHRGHHEREHGRQAGGIDFSRPLQAGDESRGTLIEQGVNVDMALERGQIGLVDGALYLGEHGFRRLRRGAG